MGFEPASTKLNIVYDHSNCTMILTMYSFNRKLYNQSFHIFPFVQHIHTIPFIQHIHTIPFLQHIHTIPFIPHIHTIQFVQQGSHSYASVKFHDFSMTFPWLSMPFSMTISHVWNVKYTKNVAITTTRALTFHVWNWSIQYWNKWNCTCLNFSEWADIKKLKCD